MVFDRISLIAIYDVLRIANENDGPVSNILMNRSSYYGTKTVRKLNSIAELKTFIEDNYPYINWNPECECATCNEGLYNLLSFTIHPRGERHAIFVNNLRESFESAKEARLNELTVNYCDNLFKNANILKSLKKTYVCFPYINSLDGLQYINPCDYIELIKNEAYNTVIERFYKATKRNDFPRIIPYKQTQCGS
jgi:hypothetical protein